MESALGVKYVLILALRSQIFEYLRETFYRHVLEYLQWVRPEKMKKKRKNPLGKRLTIIDVFEGLWSLGTRFRHYQS